MLRIIAAFDATFDEVTSPFFAIGTPPSSTINLLFLTDTHLPLCNCMKFTECLQQIDEIFVFASCLSIKSSEMKMGSGRSMEADACVKAVANLWEWWCNDLVGFGTHIV